MPASNPGTRQANDMDPPGESWTWGIILPVVYCSAQSAAAAFWRMKYYSVLHNHCGHGHNVLCMQKVNWRPRSIARHSSAHDPILILRADSAVQLTNPQLLSAISVLCPSSRALAGIRTKPYLNYWATAMVEHAILILSLCICTATSHHYLHAAVIVTGWLLLWNYSDKWLTTWKFPRSF